MGNVRDDVDFDNETNNISFFARNNSSNSPDDSKWWYVEVSNYVREDNRYISQKATGASSNIMYIRNKQSNGAWSFWARLDNFGYNSLAELATALKPLLGLS